MVSETALSKRLGIGRTPIREALQQLARERLVVVLPRRGIMVLGDQRPHAIAAAGGAPGARAADRATGGAAGERGRAYALCRGRRKHGGGGSQANDDIVFLRLDHEFNGLTLKASRNEFAAGAMTLMQGLSRRFWYIHHKEVADLPVTARLHAEIARAIAAADEGRAGQASDKLIDYVEECARATVADDA